MIPITDIFRSSYTVDKVKQPIAVAAEIKDELFGKMQSAINIDVNSKLHGGIVFDNTDTGDEGINATRYEQGDVTQNEQTYMCFVTANGVRYYVTAMEEGAYVLNQTNDNLGFAQVGVVISLISPVSGDRTYSIPFSEYDLSAVETNMAGSITIKKIAFHNIATLKYSIVNGVQNQAVDLTQSEQAIIIPDGATIIWDITKTIGGQISSLGILYTYNA